MAMEHFEFDEPRECITTVGAACVEENHHLCMGLTIDEEDVPWFCICSCHLKEKT
jgi:hypothetical protein